MSGSDYGDLKRAHAAHKTALEAEKARKSEDQTKNSEKLKRENAHGYPALKAAHIEVARKTQEEAARKQNADAAKAHFAGNAATATSPSHGNTHPTKPMQVDRQFAVAAKVDQQQPARQTGQISPSPGGTMFATQAQRVSRAAPAASSAKENSEKAVARDGVAARSETTDAVAKRETAKVNANAAQPHVPDGSRPTGRGGRGR